MTCDHTITILSTLIKEAQGRGPQYSTGVTILNRVPVDKKEVGEDVQTEGIVEGEGVGCPGTLLRGQRDRGRVAGVEATQLGG